MSRPTEVRAYLAALPALCGHRPAHHLLRDFASGAASLHEQAASWSPLLPTPGDLAGATATIEGLRRLLAELRQHVSKVSNDAV